MSPLRNPLPPPPKDIYDTTPYRTLLNLPQNASLFTANISAGQSPSRSKTGLFGRKKSHKGLFRSLSSRKHEEPEVRIVPVLIGQSDASGSSYPSGAQPAASGSGMAHMPMSNPGYPAPQPGVAQAPILPVPAAPGPAAPSALRFDQASAYGGFMNHSPHRVMYQNKTYPTATHLHEAMKYMTNRPDIAEQIRLCKDVKDVYPMSANYQQYQRTDWSQVFLTVVCG